MRKKVKDPSDFEWLKQCRFYWRENKNTVIISICDVDFEYSFEYLGKFTLQSVAVTSGHCRSNERPVISTEGKTPQ